jgi:hypothetical protein
MLDISCGLTDFEEWKQKVYLNTFPLLNPVNELHPIEPTHFTVSYNGLEAEYPIANWNSVLNTGIAVTAFNNVRVKFLKRTSTGNLQLSVASMIIRP